MVHLVGLEPTRLAALEPKSSVSAVPPQMRLKLLFQLVPMREEHLGAVGERLRLGERAALGGFLKLLQ